MATPVCFSSAMMRKISLMISGARPRLLVEHQQLRLGHQRAAHGQYLALAAGQRAGQLGAAFFEAREKLEHLVHRLHVVTVTSPVAVEGAEQQVISDAHFGEQFALLGNQRHPVAHQVLDLAFAALCVAHINDVASHRQQGHQRLQERRLAGAVGADDSDDLAAPDVQADIVQSLDLAVGHRQVPDLEYGLMLMQMRVLGRHHSTPPR